MSVEFCAAMLRYDMTFVGVGMCGSVTGRYTALQMEYSAAVKTSAEQKELIFKLEHDLSTIQAMSSLSRPAAEVRHTGCSEAA